MPKRTNHFYSVYYMPTADILYFKEKPTKGQIMKAVKKYGWGQNPTLLSPAFDIKFVQVIKEKFESQ